MFETGFENPDLINLRISNIIVRLDSDSILRGLVDPAVAARQREGVIYLLRQAENSSIPPWFKSGWNFQLERVKFHRNNLDAVELARVVDGDNISVDIVLADGTFLEVKYWRRTTLDDRLLSVVEQVQARVGAADRVVLELGKTATRPIRGLEDPVIGRLIEELASRGISVSTDPDEAAKVLISFIER